MINTIALQSTTEKERAQLKTMERKINEEMKNKNGNSEKKSKNYPMIVTSKDATTQQPRNSFGDKVRRKNSINLPKYMNQSKDLLSTSSSIILSPSREGEVSCEILDVNAIDVKGSPSFATPEINPSTTSTSIKTTTNKIDEIVEKISSRIQCATLTYERLNRIKKYFTETQILKSYESDAFEWITTNIKTIYKDPINASEKLRIAIGNRTVPVDFAIKALQPFVENHAICMTDMIKYCSYEGRNKITINELSQILKRLIKMNIKHILYNNSDHHIPT